MTKVVNSSLFGPTNQNIKCLFNSVVGIATRYWAGHSGNRIPVGARFPYPTGPILAPTQSPLQWAPGLCRV